MTEPRGRTLLLLGMLTLLLELALIRFLAGTIWNLGYFPNLVLLAVFVGMGLGFLLHARIPEERSGLAFGAAAWTLLGLVAFAHFARPAVPGFESYVGVVASEIYYTVAPPTGGPPALWSFAIWFGGVVLVFALLSQRTAKVFRRFAPLAAYSLDIGGSCLGIVAFMGVSFLQLPAWTWFLAAAVLFGLSAPPGRWNRAAVAAPLLACATIAWRGDQALIAAPAEGAPEIVRWSPYQKVEMTRKDGRLALFVNGISHQIAWSPAEIPLTFYQIPYRARAARKDLPPYRRVLVIGAGSGNDVATALLHGAEHVDAVEIDPVIARIGRDHHPAHPYRDPRVRLVVDDGRAFMTNTRDRYDLVVFALTDSLVRVSPVAQLRLENYLFTRESLQRAYGLLSETGDILLYNYYRSDLVLAKNVLLLEAATGHTPEVLDRKDDFVMFQVGPRTGRPAPAARKTSIDLTTDDWPFPYLPQRGVPPLYANVMAGVAASALLLLFALHIGAPADPAAGGLSLRLAFLLMGAAFLLLETKGIIQFSLLFGTTWLNNSLVFLAILLLVLAANRLAPRLSERRGLAGAYILLMAFCALALLVPLAWLLHVTSVPLRFLLASALLFGPVFFANLIFSLAFRDRAVPERLFGWNLIGATLGGVLEYTSMAVGYRALSVVVAGFYTVAVALLFIAARRRRDALEPAA